MQRSLLRCLSEALAAPSDKAAALCRLEELIDLSRKPDFDEHMARAYFADSGVNLEPLVRSLSARRGEAMADVEMVDMLGLLRTLSTGKPAHTH